MGHQMHEFGSLLSCDFACNLTIWSCNMLRDSLYLAPILSIQQTYFPFRSLEGKPFCNYPNGQVKTQSRSKRRGGVRLLLMTG